jgi:predicted porin
MKKSLLAIAVAAALPALAQAQVTLFGVFDMGYRDQGTGAKMASGQWAGPRIGVRGSNDIGSGLKANFHVESSIDYLGAGGSWGTTRGAFGGISGGFGRIDFGSRILTPSFYAASAVDPTGQSGITLTPYGGIGARIDKALYYTSNSLSGLVLRAAMTLGEDVERTTPTAWPNKNMMDVSAVYSAGPLTVTAAFGDTGSTDGYSVGAAYDLKMVKVSARYVESTIKNLSYPANNSSTRDTPNAALIGATIPLGAVTLFADYLSDQADGTKTDETLAGASYEFNKSTQAYIYYKGADRKDDTIGVGIRHAF